MTPRTTEERWQETHEKIMESAESLFAAKGFNGTSMNDIVGESGVSKGAIYGHFESKEQLFLSLWERQTIFGINHLKQLFSKYETALEKLLKVAEMNIASSCDCPREVVRMQLEFMIEASRIESLETDFKKRYETIHTFITELLNEGIENGEFKRELDAQALASILFATIEGLSLHYATLGKKFNSQQIQDTLINLVLEGILVN